MVCWLHAGAKTAGRVAVPIRPVAVGKPEALVVCEGRAGDGGADAWSWRPVREGNLGAEHQGSAVAQSVGRCKRTEGGSVRNLAGFA